MRSHRRHRGRSNAAAAAAHGAPAHDQKPARVCSLHECAFTPAVDPCPLAPGSLSAYKRQGPSRDPSSKPRRPSPGFTLPVAYCLPPAFCRARPARLRCPLRPTRPACSTAVGAPGRAAYLQRPAGRPTSNCTFSIAHAHFEPPRLRRRPPDRWSRSAAVAGSCQVQLPGSKSALQP